MTYEHLFNLFIFRYPDIGQLVDDYRPGGNMAILLFLKNHLIIRVEYDAEEDKFFSAKYE